MSTTLDEVVFSIGFISTGRYFGARQIFSVATVVYKPANYKMALKTISVLSVTFISLTMPTPGA